MMNSSLLPNNINSIRSIIMWSGLMIAIWFVPNQTYGQVERYPANIMPVVMPPASSYLSDYIEPGSRRLLGNVLFNDFNEASWTFRLKLTIEGGGLSLQTKQEFVPQTPITVQPGVPFVFTGSDWTEYFDFNNLNVNGNISALTASGQLPEGFYSFCMQVLDYATGDPLSTEVCQNVNIKLLDPPRVQLPDCNTIINPVAASEFQFMWQQINTINPSGGTMNYQLTIWELLEAGADPMNAVSNGQTLQVFQSDFINSTSFVYGFSQTPLELGKTYIYRIQAVDDQGRSYYKNNGYSEFCYFHYGHPTGGNIVLNYPKADAGFSRDQVPKLKYMSIDNQVPNSGINYEIVVKEVEESEEVSSAMISNDTWFYRMTSPFYRSGEFPQVIPELDIEQKYIWQVKAFSSDLEVGKSEVSTFFGPSLVEEFFANGNRVLVDYISNKDLNDLSGGGRVLLSDNPGDYGECTFEHLVLSESAGIYSLQSGSMEGTITPRQFEFDSRYEGNGAGVFTYDKFSLDPKGMKLSGRFRWELPMVVERGGQTYLETEDTWLEYNRYKLSGYLPLAESVHNIFDPVGFTLALSSTSKVYINQEKFSFYLNGVVSAPETILAVTDGRVDWTFTQEEQLETILVNRSEPIKIMAQAGIELHPLKSVIDFSDNESPGSFSADPYWKGIYLEEASLALPVGFDQDDQLSVASTLSTTLIQEPAGDTKMWLTNAGLNFFVETDFSGLETYFNTFPAEYESLVLDITNGNVNETSKLSGSLFVPFVSQQKPFAFETQIYQRGFRPGSIADLTGMEFIHNQSSGDLELNVKVLKSEIVDKKSIRMTLDLEWPTLGVSFREVPNFTVWGNYSIGFYKPEGIVALPSQVKGTFRDYPVTIDALSAGRNKDYYGISISGKVVMGDDVGGDEGAPTFNLYSMYQNDKLNDEYTPAEVQAAFDLGSAQAGLAALEEEMAAFEEDLSAQLEESLAELESSTAGSIASAAASLGGQEYAASELITETEVPVEEEENFANIKEELLKYLEVAKLLVPQPEKIDALIEQINNMGDDSNDMSGFVANLKKMISDFAVGQVAALGDDFLTKVDKISNDVNLTIITNVNKVNDEVYKQVENAVNTIVDNAANQVVNSLSQSAPNIADVVAQIAITTKRALITEVAGAVDKSINENVLFPVTEFITENLSVRAHRLVENTAKSVVLGTLSGDKNPSDIMGDVLAGFEDEIKGLGDELAGQVDMNKVLSTVKKLGQDAVGNIEPKRVVDRISQGALEAIAGAVASKAADAAADLASNLLGEEIDIDIPVDFAGAGAKLLAGGSPKDLLFDPIPVQVRSPILDIDGLIHFMKDHPLYGDGFAGEVVGLIKKPNTFAIDIVYLNGRKEGVSFWMIEVGGAAVASQGGSGGEEGATNKTEVGGKMSGDMKEPPKGLKIGPLEIMAMRGRFYHRMSGDGLGALSPDASTKYGAYLHLIMFGPQQGDRMRMEINASMSTMASGDYSFSFDGNAQFMNKAPSVYQIDMDAGVLATLQVKYNSAEKHFFGYAAATIQRPALCAQGSLLLDVKPGAWRVAIGSKEEKIRFVMACAGFGPTGWLDINQNVIQLGLGLEFIFRTDINLDVKIAAVGLLIDAGAAAGIQAMIQYKPSFIIMEAGVWLELWAKILLTYKTPIKKGQVTLADIYLAADAIMRFHPSPTLLYGQVNGRIKVLFLNFSFDKSFEMKMS